MTEKSGRAMTSAYSFNQQLAQGESGERFLDRFFGLFYEITPATRDEQRRGIDRRFKSRWTHWDYLFEQKADNAPVEYKSDFLAHQTGNAFVETVSVDTAHKDGWLITSQAYILAYFVVYSQVIYISRIDRLRALAPLWNAAYPVRWAQNKGYHTHGMAVPLTQYQRSAYKVIQL